MVCGCALNSDAYYACPGGKISRKERDVSESLYMNKEMADRLDPLFPEAGGLMRLVQVRKDSASALADPNEKVGRTSFHPSDVAHIRKAFRLLADDEDAKAALISWIAYAQMKSDVAHL